jgi:WD40 repeat protein/serine/threonine protein kinase
VAIDFQRVQSVFQAVAELSLAERAAVLEQECGDDAELRRCVDALLQAHDDSRELPQADPQRTGAYEPAETPGAMIGPYKLLELIGEGGMGTVWMAEQKEPIHRRVAIKVIKAGMDSKQVLARFEAERQALALMDHSNIARVLDAGLIGAPHEPEALATDRTKSVAYSSGSSRPYFVMELVKGQPITKYCDDKHLSVRERLELFADVCRAVQHAHQKGIIHRDLKPSNILIAPFDGKPVVKVIDFGVAKATGQRLTDATLFTGFGAVVGTPEYMSPEQAETNNQDIDTRSDIYSLGVLLYELLTGSTPLTKIRVKEAALLEVLRVIREEEPPKPSTRLSSSEELPAISAQRHTEPAKLTKLVRGELDWIVMKALDKDRNRRYETANGFAMDVQRYLADEPVLAGPPSTRYRLRKFMKRNRGPVVAATVVFLALVAGVVGTTLALVEATRQQRIAETNQQIAETNADKAKEEERNAKVARDEAKGLARKEEAARRQAEKQLLRTKTLLYISNLTEAHNHFLNHDLVRCRIALDDCDSDLRGPEYGYLVNQLVKKARILRGHTNGVLSLALSGDNMRLFSGQLLDGAIKVWNLETGKEILALRGHTNAASSLALYQSGKRLASGGGDRTIRVWDLETNKEILTLRGHTAMVSSLALSRDGHRLFSGGGVGDNTIKVWDLKVGKELRTLHGHTAAVSDLVLSGDNRRLFSCSGDGTIKVWDLESGRELRTLGGNSGSVEGLALRGDGKRLFSAGLDIKVWDLETGKEILTLRGPMNSTKLALSCDGKRLFSGRLDGTIQVWDLEAGRKALALRGHTGSITGLALYADGKRLVSGSLDKSLQVWDLEGGKEALALRGHRGEIIGLALSGDGERLFSGAHLDGAIKVWDVKAGKETYSLRGDTGKVLGLALSGDSKRLVARGGGGTLDVWDLDAGKVVRTLRERQGLDSRAAMALSGNGKRLCTGTLFGISVWDLETGKETLTLGGHKDSALGLALSRDGRRLVSGRMDTTILGAPSGTITVWDLETGKETRTLRGHQGWVFSLALSGDGKQLFSAGLDDAIKVWDLESGKETHALRGHQGGILSLLLSRDGKRLYSAGVDRTIRIWDLEVGKETLTLRGHTGTVTHLVLPDDGKRLASGDADGIIKIWDLEAVQ